MKVGMLLLTNFPPDIRVEKEITSLDNHEIYMLCTRRGSNQNLKYEELENIKITRIFDKPLRVISNLGLLLFRKSRLWEKEIEKFVQNNQLDVLHVHDLPLAGSAFNVAQKLKIETVLDLHENYPEMLRESKKKSLLEEFTLPQLIIKFTSIAKWKNYEREVLIKFNNIIVVIEEAKNRLVNDLGIIAENIHVIPNYDYRRENTRRTIVNTRLTFVYSGGFDNVRDLETIVKAVNLLDDKIKDKIKVKLIGGEGKELIKLQNIIENFNLEHVVQLYRFMPFTEMYNHLLSADVGLVAHKKSAHTDNTIPHKLFQYMNLGLPVIASNCSPLERIIEQSKCGLIYESENEESLALVMKRMFVGVNERSSMSKNAIRAIDENYNWDVCTERVVKMYKKLSK